ncbi:hypothetical protein ACTJJ0_27680 [Chitinophaga sp. 22321]|uniref:DUF5666 domain-containing protein n=1 Tax=Chitinophaga hostae TaxID=2831022 RepID=A0ABS5J7C8_9BACT|nr:hypothetical protein [Chitinophaga hostae]MBS0030958.1 hypothetical protein [Chitinophaga hostae]
MKPIFFCGALLLLTACDSTPAKQAAGDTTAVVKDVQPVENEKPVKEVTGKVKAIVSGKDGYTAKIVSDDGKEYAATVSHANLKDPTQYRTVKEGDRVTVKGDSWMMGQEEQITVRELR